MQDTPEVFSKARRSQSGWSNQLYGTVGGGVPVTETRQRSQNPLYDGADEIAPESLYATLPHTMGHPVVEEEALYAEFDFDDPSKSTLAAPVYNEAKRKEDLYLTINNRQQHDEHGYLDVSAQPHPYHTAFKSNIGSDYMTVTAAENLGDENGYMCVQRETENPYFLVSAAAMESQHLGRNRQSGVEKSDPEYITLSGQSVPKQNQPADGELVDAVTANDGSAYMTLGSVQEDE